LVLVRQLLRGCYTTFFASHLANDPKHSKAQILHSMNHPQNPSKVHIY